MFSLCALNVHQVKEALGRAEYQWVASGDGCSVVSTTSLDAGRIGVPGVKISIRDSVQLSSKKAMVVT